MDETNEVEALLVKFYDAATHDRSGDTVRAGVAAVRDAVLASLAARGGTLSVHKMKEVFRTTLLASDAGRDVIPHIETQGATIAALQRDRDAWMEVAALVLGPDEAGPSDAMRNLQRLLDLRTSLQQRVAELEKGQQTARCLYCAAEWEVTLDKAQQNMSLLEHVAKCEKHPMRVLERRVTELDESLRKADTSASAAANRAEVALSRAERAERERDEARAGRSDAHGTSEARLRAWSRTLAKKREWSTRCRAAESALATLRQAVDPVLRDLMGYEKYALSKDPRDSDSKRTVTVTLTVAEARALRAAVATPAPEHPDTVALRAIRERAKDWAALAHIADTKSSPRDVAYYAVRYVHGGPLDPLGDSGPSGGWCTAHGPNADCDPETPEVYECRAGERSGRLVAATPIHAGPSGGGETPTWWADVVATALSKPVIYEIGHVSETEARAAAERYLAACKVGHGYVTVYCDGAQTVTAKVRSTSNGPMWDTPPGLAACVPVEAEAANCGAIPSGSRPGAITPCHLPAGHDGAHEGTIPAEPETLRTQVDLCKKQRQETVTDTVNVHVCSHGSLKPCGMCDPIEAEDWATVENAVECFKEHPNTPRSEADALVSAIDRLKQARQRAAEEMRERCAKAIVTLKGEATSRLHGDDQDAFLGAVDVAEERIRALPLKPE